MTSKAPKPIANVQMMGLVAELVHCSSGIGANVSDDALERKGGERVAGRIILNMLPKTKAPRVLFNTFVLLQRYPTNVCGRPPPATDLFVN